MKRVFFIMVLVLSQIYFGQERRQNLQVHWPEEYKWKIITNQEDDTVHFIELIPEKETPDKWTLIGTMTSFKKTIVPSADIIIKIYEEASLKESPLAKLTVLEKSKEGDGIWVLFKVETPSFPNDPKPESQLWYVIQGEYTLYSMFIAKKEKTLSEESVKRWSKVFKSSEFSYEYSDKSP